MLPLVGDIDVMSHRSTELAIPQGHPPPTQLPDEFHNNVKVHEIVDSYLPGYVYLKLRYLLSECIEEEKYNYFKCDNWLYLSNRFQKEDAESRLFGGTGYDIERLTVEAPSVSRHLTPLLPVDYVRCVRCLSWPPQAADWSTRQRNYGWPDSATVGHVVSNGCDVVGVAHRQCRQHEWMGKNQWRLSFSRAEIVLINSWMPVQQIVYHMLRFFMKTNRLIHGYYSRRVIVSKYHIKTLVLWTSEQKPRSWWAENLNFVRICVELLHTLAVCLTDTCCPHYFVSNCNLLDNSLSVGMVASELMSIDEAYLSTRFVHTYIGECAKLCPHYIAQLSNDIDIELKNVVSAIANFRRNTSVHALLYAEEFTKMYISLVVSRYMLNVRSCIVWMNQLSARNVRLS